MLLLKKETVEQKDGRRYPTTRWLHLAQCVSIPESVANVLNRLTAAPPES
jgi:hypothetical protein